MTQFRGAFTAIVTPMKESGEVDYDGFRRIIEFQITEGIDGIVPLGTTGETPTLDEDEEDIADNAREAVVYFCKAGIVGGRGENRFDPKGDSTRAEIAAMIYRLLETAEITINEAEPLAEASSGEVPAEDVPIAVEPAQNIPHEGDFYNVE